MNCELCTKNAKVYEIDPNVYRCIECLYCYSCFKDFNLADNVNVRYTFLSTLECETDYLCNQCNNIPRPAWYYALITEMQDCTCRVKYRKLYNIYTHAKNYLSMNDCTLSEFRKLMGLTVDPFIDYVDNYTLYA